MDEAAAAATAAADAPVLEAPVLWTAEDARALAAVVMNRQARRAARAAGARNAWPLGAGLAAAVLLAVGLDAASGRTGGLSVLGIAALGGTVAGALGMRLELGRASERAVALAHEANPNLYGPGEVRLDGRGVEVRVAAGVETLASWAAVRGATREAGLVLFWLDPDRPLAVPERGLPAGLAERLLDAALDRLSGAPMLDERGRIVGRRLASVVEASAAPASASGVATSHAPPRPNRPPGG